MGEPDTGFWLRRFESGCDCGCDRGECDEPDPAERNDPDCLIAVCPGCGRVVMWRSLECITRQDAEQFAGEARRRGCRFEMALTDDIADRVGRCRCVENALAAQPALPGVADDQP